MTCNEPRNAFCFNLNGIQRFFVDLHELSIFSVSILTSKDCLGCLLHSLKFSR